MTDSLISVIVPAFNAETHLERCLASILSQTYHPIEVIVVDDGSTDGTLQVARTAANEDERVHVLSQVNGGVSTARNLGLDAAHGDWVSFIDADDWLESTTYSTVSLCFGNGEVDFVTFGYFVDTPSESKGVAVSESYLGFGDAKRGLEILLETQNRFAWSRVFRRETIGNTRFDPTVHWGEDTLFVAEVATKARGSMTIGVPLYHYEQSQGSATRSAVNPKRLSGIQMTESLQQVVGRFHPALLYTVLTTRVNILSTLITDEVLEGSRDGTSRLPHLRRVLARDLHSVLASKEIRPQTKVKAVTAALAPRLLAFRDQTR